ncbi:MAG TPA: hypothetical protein VKV02_01520, partial [Acidobacteriaceae bacterium]|nr:hypothetical protein [Acidobacteriaceae bacterium]
MIHAPIRPRLPRLTDRLPLGGSGLFVSPFCLGMTQDPRVVLEAFDQGVNFFFVTADLHWPLYEGLRSGLAQLFARPGVRAQCVVAVVSYLEEPLFRYLQFHEVLAQVPGLAYVDLVLAGAVSSLESLNARLPPMYTARTLGSLGTRAVGATFHDRGTALLSANANCMDIQFIRYNSAHPGARTDIFPLLTAPRRSLLFNFKSMLGLLSARAALGEHAAALAPTDAYRFVLSTPYVDGALLSPQSPQEVRDLVRMTEQEPFTPAEQEYLIALSAA